MLHHNNSSRRNFLKTTGKTALAASLALPGLQSFAGFAHQPAADGVPADEIGWTQQPLGYAYNAIEPSIDAMTMEIHYTKHAASYAKTLADAVKEENVDTAASTLPQLLSRISKYSTKMRNNAGGHYNHELFWKSLTTPGKSGGVSGKLAEQIKRDFGSTEAFRNQFNEAAKSRFGSGWAWLVLNADKKLVVTSTPNQDNPLMDVADIKGFPVLGLDVWEHAYYLKYQNKRPDYITAWWNAVNWSFIQQRFEKA